MSAPLRAQHQEHLCRWKPFFLCFPFPARGVHVQCSLGDGGACSHIHKHDNQEHHHSQRGQHHRGDLLPSLLHGLLPLLLILWRLLLGLSFELPHLSWWMLRGYIQRGFEGRATLLYSQGRERPAGRTFIIKNEQYERKTNAKLKASIEGKISATEVTLSSESSDNTLVNSLITSLLEWEFKTSRALISAGYSSRRWITGGQGWRDRTVLSGLTLEGCMISYRESRAWVGLRFYHLPKLWFPCGEFCGSW